MQEVLTDWLWKIDIKDPRFIKGYSKLTPVAKKIALEKYNKDANKNSHSIIYHFDFYPFL